jgi:hypothetical protein
VSKALGAFGLLLVEGPPGAGKTSFICELINQYLAARLRYKVLLVSQMHVVRYNVLLVSQMHVAIDNAFTSRASPRRDGPVRCLSRISTQVREFSWEADGFTQARLGPVVRHCDATSVGCAADGAGASQRWMVGWWGPGVRGAATATRHRPLPSLTSIIRMAAPPRARRVGSPRSVAAST